MPSNIPPLADIPSWTGKIFLYMENNYFLANSDLIFNHVKVERSITHTFLKEMENGIRDLTNPPQMGRTRVAKGIKYVTRFTLTFGIIAVVAPLGTVVNAVPFTFTIFALPCRYIYYTYKNQPAERRAARQKDWNRIKYFADGFFRDLALASTFHLSLLPIFMGYKLGAIYAISLTAYTAFSTDVALKILAPAKVRAGFMKAILLRNQFGLIAEKGELLYFIPENEDETNAGAGHFYQAYNDLANEIRNQMLAANLDHVQWQGDDPDSKNRFLGTIRHTVPPDTYEQIKKKVEMFWILRWVLVECIYCREYSIFHDRREKANVKIPIPEVLTGVRRDSGPHYGSGPNGDAAPPPTSDWIRDLNNALTAVGDDGKTKIISAANGLPDYSNPEMKDAYRVFRQGILNKMDFSSLFADKQNPYNKAKVLATSSFYKKMAILFHPDKTQSFAPHLIKEAIELFKLLNNAYERLSK